MATSSSLDISLAGGSKVGLFTNQIIKFVVLGLGCVFAVMIGVQITDSETNGLATFSRYIAAATFITAMISPRLGIYLVLCMCPMLDLLKRCLILYTNVNMFDVASVLAIAPVTMAGAVGGTVFNRLIFRRQAAVPGESKLFLILLALISLVILSGVLHNVDSKITLMRNLAEACIYLCLILLIPTYFPKTEDIATLLRWCLVVFVPVALYGYWQKAFGISDFEERYLLSGLTVMSEDYFNTGRVFSTLNSNHSFSVTMACCAIISLLQRQLPADVKWQVWVKKRAGWLFLIFCIATMISLRRTGWLLVGFSLVGAACFRTRLRTIVFYSACLVGTMTIILNAEYIYTRLPSWETSLQSSIPGYDQALGLQTFNDRLSSFETLKSNPAIWSAFGLTTEQRDGIFVHDAISQTLVSYGVVGMLAFMTVLFVVLSTSHRLVWKATDPAALYYAALLLAFIFSNLFVGALMQSHIDIFPVNFIFWMCAGALLKITFNQQTIVETKPKIDLAALAAALQAAKRPITAQMSGYSLPGR